MRRLVLAFAALALPAGAQVQLGVDAGAAVPLGAIGTYRSTGASATVTAGWARSGWSPRADLAVAFLPDPSRPVETGQNSGEGDYTSIGARASLVYRGRGTRAVPYGLAGGGLYRVAVDQDESPYGDWFGGLHLGGGVEVPAGSVTASVEVGVVAMATDYGAGAFNFPTTHVPVTVGVRF